MKGEQTLSLSLSIYIYIYIKINDFSHKLIIKI